MFKLISLNSILAAMLASSSLAGAQESREVHFADLDLTTAAGQATLDRRLTGAAIQVCGTGSYYDRNELRVRKACRVKTLERARRQAELAIARAVAADNPKLAAKN